MAREMHEDKNWQRTLQKQDRQHVKQEISARHNQRSRCEKNQSLNLRQIPV